MVRPSVRPALFAVLIATSATAFAQQQAGQVPATASSTAAAQAETGKPPQRIRNVQLERGQACPPGTGDEIVVCSTLEEPYRIPKQFRDDKPIAAQNQSWVNRAAALDNASRVAAGLPDTCSANGSGGQTGCALQANRQWAAEKRAQARAAESVPGGE